MIDSKATLVIAHNPFDPSKDRQIERINSGGSIRTWVDENSEILTYPAICTLNGAPVLRTTWNDIIIQEADVVVFFRLPEGGGGGDGGKNPLLAVVGIALMVVGAVFTGGLVAVALVGVGAVATIMGSGLLSPPEVPSIDQRAHQSSPTYSLTSQGNNARLGEAIPVIYGKHKIYPDFATAPYSEFIANEQFLYHIMVVGQGEYDIHDVFIDDTPIEDFDEITWQKIDPGGFPSGLVSTFDHSVITAAEVSGQELQGGPVGWSFCF